MWHCLQKAVFCTNSDNFVLLSILLRDFYRTLFFILIQAAEGFCRKNNVSVDCLYRRIDGMQNKLFPLNCHSLSYQCLFVLFVFNFITAPCILLIVISYLCSSSLLMCFVRITIGIDCIEFIEPIICAGQHRYHKVIKSYLLQAHRLSEDRRAAFLSWVDLL